MISQRRSLVHRMRLSRRVAWACLVAVWSLACQQDVAAPGSCPDYCPATRIDVLDSVIPGAFVRDSTFTGYVLASEARAMQLITEGSSPESRSVIRFVAFPEELPLAAGQSVPIIALDSFQLDLIVRRRPETVTGIELDIHRLPATLDTLATFTSLAPYFEDSTLIATILVPDTATSGDSLSAILDTTAFPNFEADGRTIAVGVVMRAAEAGFLDLGTLNGGEPARLVRFVQTASGDNSDFLGPQLDTYVFEDLPAPGVEALVIGGAPSSRSLLRIDLPPDIIDSTEIVRATLILVPEEPAIGAPQDTFMIRAGIVTVDIGAKSPIVPLPGDEPGLGAANVPVGSSDSVHIEVTAIVRPWRTNPDLPRSIMLRVDSEASSVGQVRVSSSRGARPPALHLTYIPLFLGTGQ